MLELSQNCEYFLEKFQFLYSFLIQYLNTRGVFRAKSQFYIPKLPCFCQLNKEGAGGRERGRVF